jgi:hypothetical protein
MFGRCWVFPVAFALLMSATLANAQTPAPGPVVIELFTSEGCSSCPPADRMLAQLQNQHKLGNAELIVLGEHVDYWNSLGWQDRFSQHSLTQRQESYARVSNTQVYTPELVVDGQPSDTGSDPAAILRSINGSARRPKQAQVSTDWAGPGQLRVSVANGGNGNAVLLFVTEDDLSTKVKAGENGGTTLHHAAVVRQVRRLGETRKGSFNDTAAIKWDPDWQPKAVRFLVLVQERNGAGKIVGAAAVKPREPVSAAQGIPSE